MSEVRDLEDILNRMNPGAAHVQLGTVLKELLASHNALLAKLDADAGITDEDYEATLALTELADR